MASGRVQGILLTSATDQTQDTSVREKFKKWHCLALAEAVVMHEITIEIKLCSCTQLMPT